MNKKIVIFSILLSLGVSGFAQKAPRWDNWNFLLGTWKGEGTGQPGQGGGTFSFFLDLDKNILVRKSHSEYPAIIDKPAIIHEDFMIIYPDHDGIPSKAIYFDNEGHQIKYNISYYENSVILLSEKTDGQPLFRLTYSLIDKETVNTRFEMSQNGVDFMKYIEGNSRKVE